MVFVLLDRSVNRYSTPPATINSRVGCGPKLSYQKEEYLHFLEKPAFGGHSSVSEEPVGSDRDHLQALAYSLAVERAGSSHGASTNWPNAATTSQGPPVCSHNVICGLKHPSMASCCVPSPTLFEVNVGALIV